MNLHREKTRSAQFYRLSLMIAAVLICPSISAAFGQERSEDRDNPLYSTQIKLTTTLMEPTLNTSTSSLLAREINCDI